MESFTLFLLAVVISLDHFKQYDCSEDSSISVETVLSSPLEIQINSLDSNVENSTETERIKKSNFEPKSRRKRYVAFPEGSTFSVTIHSTITLLLS